jgi:hypothetical protein
MCFDVVKSWNHVEITKKQDLEKIFQFDFFDGCRRGRESLWWFVIHQCSVFNHKWSSWPYRSSPCYDSEIFRGMVNIGWTNGVSILDGLTSWRVNIREYKTIRDTQIHGVHEWPHIGMKKILEGVEWIWLFNENSDVIEERTEPRYPNGSKSRLTYIIWLTVRGKGSQRFKVKIRLTPLWIAVELMTQNGSERRI